MLKIPKVVKEIFYATSARRRYASSKLQWFEKNAVLSMVALVSLILGGVYGQWQKSIATTARVLAPHSIPVTQYSANHLLQKYLVKVGDKVERNQPLLLTTDALFAHEYQLGRTRYLALLATISRLNAEARGDKMIVFPKEVKKLTEVVNEETAIFNLHQTQLQTQLKALTQHYQLAESQLTALSHLVQQGIVPEKDLMPIQASLIDLRESIPNGSKKLQQSADASLAVKTRALSELATILNTEQTYIESQAVRAPITGTVEKIGVTNTGTLLSVGQPLMTIVPWRPYILLAAPLFGAQTPVFHVGQKVKIQIKAPSKTFVLNGVVEAIRPDNSDKSHANHQSNLEDSHIFMAIAQKDFPKAAPLLQPDQIVPILITS